MKQQDSNCEITIAIVSLVAVNRQWFESKVGLEMTQSRDVSFCAHTILQPDVFIVADILADQLFATNPLGLILPEASLEVTSEQTEQMRQGIKHLKLKSQFRSAGAALYCATNEGRVAIRLAS